VKLQLYTGRSAQPSLLIRASPFRKFPASPPPQPIFYRWLSEEHATRIARDWNTKDEASGFAGYILRFKLRGEFLSPYKLHRVGSAQHPKYLDSEPRGSGSGMFTMDVSPRAGS